MRSLHKLNDTLIRSFKPRKTERLSDGGGLYLVCHPTGRKVWQFKFRDSGSALKSMSIGEYPGAGLAEARKRAAEMRDAVVSGSNPASVKDREEPIRKWAEIVLAAKADGTKNGKRLAPATIKRDTLVLGHILAEIGDLDIRTATTSQLDDGLRKVASIENRYRCRYLLGEIFSWAVYREIIRFNVAAPLAAVHRQPETEGYPVITDPVAVGKLLLAIQGYPAQAGIEIALELLLRSGMRPGEVRQARWSWIDLEKRTLELPPAITKTREGRTVFLADQSVKLLSRLESDRYPGGDLVFPAARSRRVAKLAPPSGNPISDMSMNMALQRMGYDSDVFVPHSCRKVLSTFANESGLHRPDVIEAALGHVQGGVRSIYNKATYEKEQRELMQWWSDELDRLLSLT